VHPLLTNPRGLAAWLLGWGFAGLLLASAWQAPLSAEWGWALAFTLPVALVAGLAALAMAPVCRSLPLRPARWVSRLAQRGVAALLLALLVTGAAALGNLVVGSLVARAGLVALSAPELLTLFALQVTVGLLSALGHDALFAQEAARQAEADALQARLHAREMEITALRHQIDPHFLFNSLNSISALTHADPAAARAMTLDLADFFRLTLRLGAQPQVRLADELALLRSYVAVEQRRLGDRLTLVIDADDACLGAWLPPLLLQPLVENALQHGVRARADGGRIDVQVRRAGERLRLSVVNPLPALADRGDRQDRRGLGQGQTVLRQRLQALYRDAAAVSVTRGDGHYRVDLTLPWQP